jgi:hypothetical protein
VFGIAGRLAACVARAAIAACGFLWISTRHQLLVDNGFAHAGYDPEADEQADTEPALGRAHAASPTNGSFRPAVLQSLPMHAAGVDADTLRPRDKPTPLNRPPLLATVPTPTADSNCDLADGSRESPTSCIAVDSISMWRPVRPRRAVGTKRPRTLVRETRHTDSTSSPNRRANAYSNSLCRAWRCAHADGRARLGPSRRSLWQLAGQNQDGEGAVRGGAKGPSFVKAFAYVHFLGNRGWKERHGG